MFNHRTCYEVLHETRMKQLSNQPLNDIMYIHLVDQQITDIIKNNTKHL